MRFSVIHTFFFYKLWLLCATVVVHKLNSFYLGFFLQHIFYLFMHRLHLFACIVFFHLNKQMQKSLDLEFLFGKHHTVAKNTHP